MSFSQFVSRKSVVLGALLTCVVAAPALAIGAIGTVDPSAAPAWAAPYVEFLHRDSALPPVAFTPQVFGWRGADIDGDGASDIFNPTGRAPRIHDDYGDGYFGAWRDGGARRHDGVDYVAGVGQLVRAPISGFVSKIGFAYPDDASLRYIEIENPALALSARVFYVSPAVQVGQAVRLGRPIGVAQDLQVRYSGITDHVHLEVADRRGRKLDAARLLHVRLEGGERLAEASFTPSGD